MTKKSKNDNSKKNISSTANDRIGDLFTEAFQNIVSDPKNKINVEEFECNVTKTVGTNEVTVDVRIYGFAGNTSQDEFCVKGGNGEYKLLKKGAENVVIKLDDDSLVTFQFKKCMNLDATDYLLTYIVKS